MRFLIIPASLILPAILSATFALPAFPDCVLREDSKILASDGASGDRLGRALAISGEYAIAGADSDDEDGTDAGAAYILRKSDDGTWHEETKLTASDGAANDYFGNSVAILGDLAVAGAWFDDAGAADSGSAYVFRYDGAGWHEEAKLTASDGEASEYFGISVAIAAGAILVGAGWDDENGAGSGSVYLFEYDGKDWVEQGKLTPEEAEAGDNFGISIAADGDLAVIGARWRDDNGTDSGAAYVFRSQEGEWIEEATLLAADGTEYDLFGSAVSVSGNWICVGALFDDDNGLLSGSAYMFTQVNGEWSEFTKLLPADPASGDDFGNAVAVTGDRAVIGAYNYAGNAENGGLAYLFEYDGVAWTEAGKMAPAKSAENDLFGYAVAAAGAVTFAGALFDDENGEDSGAVYLYATSECPVEFVRGDGNGDGVLDLGDAIMTLVYLFTSGEAPGCLAASDCNSDAALTLGDPIYLLRYLFLDGASPGAPFPDCGPPPSAAATLSCTHIPTCR